MKNILVALLLGIVLGAAGYWYVQQEAAKKAEERATQAVAQAGKATAATAADIGQKLAAKFEALELGAQALREEFAQTGKVVRRKAREIGQATADAAVDARVTAEIKAKLAADSQLSALSIAVNTSDGRVTLAGTVAAPELIGKAILIALETADAREVVSTLQVK
ncbi:MAG: BON domain-containing protein [Burkholderiaceae bacterium]